MSDPQQETDTIEIELVSYLDGELSAEAVARVESRLQDDDKYRQQLHDLRRSWDMLDLLSRPAVSDDFTDATLEVTLLEARDDATTLAMQSTRRRWTTWALAAGCSCLSLAAGFLLFTGIFGRADRELLRELPIIENVDYYTYGDNIEFIRALRDAGAFSGSVAEPLGFALESEPISDRRARLAALSADEKERIQHKRQRFENLSDAERKKVLDLHASIMRSEQAKELQLTLVRYNDWLKTLSTDQRYELLRLETEQRIARVQELQQERESKHLNQVVDQGLSADDWRRLIQWLQKVMREREPTIIASMTPTQQLMLEKTRDPFQRRRMLMAGLRKQPQLQQVTKQEFESLRGRLSPGGQDVLDKMVQSGDKATMLTTWYRQLSEVQSKVRAAPRAKVNDRELFGFLKQLPRAEQARLRNLPADQMWNQLKILYLMRKRPAQDRLNEDGPLPGDRPDPRGGGRGNPPFNRRGV